MFVIAVKYDHNEHVNVNMFAESDDAWFTFFDIVRMGCNVTLRHTDSMKTVYWTAKKGFQYSIA